jgi:hypothetical protein
LPHAVLIDVVGIPTHILVIVADDRTLHPPIVDFLVAEVAIHPPLLILVAFVHVTAELDFSFHHFHY